MVLWPIVRYHHAEIPTLPICPGVSRKIDKSPGLPVRQWNLPSSWKNPLISPDFNEILPRKIIIANMQYVTRFPLIYSMSFILNKFVQINLLGICFHSYIILKLNIMNIIHYCTVGWLQKYNRFVKKISESQYINVINWNILLSFKFSVIMASKKKYKCVFNDSMRENYLFTKKICE